jgi:Nucleotidyltransferase domain
MQNDDALLDRLVRAFGGVPGVRAIVLGGSRARGEATAASDYDIGLYYEPDHPIDIGRLAKAVTTLPGPATSSVTAIGEWGPWINGGAWLTVAGMRVDLLYRDLGKVRAVIEACCAGKIERVYQPGHPHAFVSSIYMGEVALGRVLWDPDGVMTPLKRTCDPYPSALGETLIRSFFWEAKFALENALHGRGRDDPAYVAGCAFRCVACLCQALFALNRVYLLNEKAASAGVERLAVKPHDFAGRVRQAVAAGAAGLALLMALVEETAALLNSSPREGERTGEGAPKTACNPLT